MALLAAAYGWSPEVLRQLTDAEAAYYLGHMREVHLRMAFPAAQLEATLRNMMGGKRRKEPKEGDEPPLADHELFSPFELLPWYARPEWIEESGGTSLSRDAARDFLAHLRDVPAWVLEVAPLHAIKHAAQA